MTTGERDRSGEALTKDRIVRTAVAILDEKGERALTFRALATRLSTGAGALYWHIADKDALLAACADHVVALALSTIDDGTEPGDAIRAMALALYDAFDAHPWMGARLSLDPEQEAMIRFLEGIGGQLIALGVRESLRFGVWSACVNYILGVAGQNAAHARHRPRDADREAILAAVAGRWTTLDPVRFPFLREAAAHLPGHDDRAQFLAGIDIILAGVKRREGLQAVSDDAVETATHKVRRSSKAP